MPPSTSSTGSITMTGRPHVKLPIRMAQKSTSAIALPASKADLTLRNRLQLRALPSPNPGAQGAARHTAPSQLHPSLEAAFRQSTERMQAELTVLRTVCASVLTAEWKDKELLRAQCLALTQERNLAREKLRAVAERLVQPVPQAASHRGTKRGLDERNDIVPRPCSLPVPPSSVPTPTSPVKDDIEEADVGTMDFMYPSCSETNPGAPSTEAAAKRSNSAGPILAGETAAASAVMANVRSPREPPTKRRRYSASSDSSAASSSRTLVASSSCSPPSSAVAEASPDTSSVKPGRPRLDIMHIDLMYMSRGRMLFCRPCILQRDKSATQGSPPPQECKSFLEDSSWDALRQHCEQEHPVACADLAKLSSTQIMLLRNRLTMPAA